MVKLGFIGEGHTERTILISDRLRAFLNKLGLDFVEEAIDAKGSGNLLPQYLEDHVILLQKQGATQIVILADKEDSPCITSVKARIDPEQKFMVVIAVRDIEAWFLADTAAISSFIGHNFRCEEPESIANPFEFIKTEKLRLVNRGVNSKRLLSSRMLLNGFSLEAAAAHPNCPSARYFLQKLTSLANTTDIPSKTNGEQS